MSTPSRKTEFHEAQSISSGDEDALLPSTHCRDRFSANVPEEHPEPSPAFQHRVPGLIAVGDVEPGMTTTLPRGFPIRKTFMGSSVFDACSTNPTSWPGAVHSGQANLLFCDGHVESARTTNWIAASPGARARWNNDHEPHPETWPRP